MKLEFDYTLLKDLILKKFKTQREFAKAANIDAGALSRKLKNISYWKSYEMYTVCKLLDIPLSDVKDYFFKPKV